MKHIDILQLILDRIVQAENNELPDFKNSTWYAMAIKDLAAILWIDPDNYWVNNK